MRQLSGNNITKTIENRVDAMGPAGYGVLGPHIVISRFVNNFSGASIGPRCSRKWPECN